MKASLEAIKERCEEEGDCWIWKGGIGGSGGQPQMRCDGKIKTVRRVVAELNGPIAPGMAAYNTCGQILCVSPHCVKAMTKNKAYGIFAKLGIFNAPEKARKASITVRAKSHITDDLCQTLRSLGKKEWRPWAEQHNISLSHGKAIRGGRARLDYTNPWNGLGGR